MTLHTTVETTADRLIPGDRIRRGGREFRIEQVQITVGEAVFLVMSVANDDDAPPLQLRLDGGELVRRVP